MREHDRLREESVNYRRTITENSILESQAKKDRKLKKRLREWIKAESIEVPDDIRKMIGWV